MCTVKSQKRKIQVYLEDFKVRIMWIRDFPEWGDIFLNIAEVDALKAKF